MEDQSFGEDKALYVKGLLKFFANQGKLGEMKNSIGQVQNFFGFFF